MATNRLFLMLYFLLEKGTATAPELAAHFEVSVRRIYRDIDILSAAGVPIYATQDKGGGISIPNNFVLNKSLVSEEEQTQILMALQGIGIIDDVNTNSVLSKLSTLFKKQNINWIEIDYSDWNRDSNSNFNTLKQAIFGQNRVEFIYFSAKGEPTDRQAEPLKLVFRNKDWYLYAYCCLRNDYRFFKLSRIKKLTITTLSFTRIAPARVFEHSNPHDEQPITITLLFDKKMAHRVYDHFDNITAKEDGNLLVKVRISNMKNIYN